jgi:hypothetical protein
MGGGDYSGKVKGLNGKIDSCQEGGADGCANAHCMDDNLCFDGCDDVARLTHQGLIRQLQPRGSTT